MMINEAVGTRDVVVGLGYDLDDVVATILEVQEIVETDYRLVQKPASDTDWSFMHTVREAYEVRYKKWVKVEERPATEEERVTFWKEYDNLLFG